MAAGWVKAFQCKTNAIEDVYHQPPLKPPLPSTPKKHSSTTNSSSSSKTSKPPLLPLGCGNTSHHLKDIIILKKQSKPKSTAKSMSTPSPAIHPPPFPSQSKPSPKPKSQSLSSLPTLLPLRPNHSSRRVVEIIFTSSWTSPSSQSSPPKFPGEIEMLFKIHNPPRMVSRFEEYRDLVRLRAGRDSSRCAADGNEMMRFQPAPANLDSGISGEPIFDARMVWPRGEDGGITTFAGSGGAHGHGGGGGGGGRKRRAMLVCRVIAGRVWSGFVSDRIPVEYESVSVRNGELVVFDRRAILPCFLVIYKI